MADHVPAGWYPTDDHTERWWDGRQWGAQTRPRPDAGLGHPSAWPTPPAYVVPQTQTATVQVVVSWVLTIVTAGYFLPWAIAATRGKANAGTIGWVNFLLGWTLIGWVVALAMSVSAHKTVVVRR